MLARDMLLTRDVGGAKADTFQRGAQVPSPAKL